MLVVPLCDNNERYWLFADSVKINFDTTFSWLLSIIENNFNMAVAANDAEFAKCAATYIFTLW